MLNRRALLQRAILLVGGSLGLPFEAFAKDGRAQPKFFTPAQFAILDDVAETMIPATDTPGARAVGVPQICDTLMLNWASETSRTEFAALLSDIDALAMAQEGKGFTALAPERKTAFLLRYDKTTLPTAPRHDDILIGGAKLPRDPPYVRFKELVVTVYYLSEIGATQELRYEHDPNLWDPAMKMTAETRAWAIPT